MGQTFATKHMLESKELQALPLMSFSVQGIITLKEIRRPLSGFGPWLVVG